MNDMNELESTNNARLTVENFGPIAKAKIDFRPLTVFVGPSNTGKSYLAILVYALYKFFHRRNFMLSWYLTDLRQSNIEKDKEEYKKISSAVNSVIETVLDNENSPNEPKISIPSEFCNFVASKISGYTPSLNKEICRCFGVDNVTELNRHQRHSSMIKICNQFLSVPGHIQFKHIFCRKNREMELDISRDLSLIFDEINGKNLARLLLSESIDDRMLLMADTLYNFVYSRIVPSSNQLAYYLPASRTGIMHTRRVLVNALIAQTSERGPRSSPGTQMLSGVLSDFLNDLINIGQPHGARPDSIDDWGADIENSILRGSVNISKSEDSGYSQFYYRPNGSAANLPLMHTSAMVSELAPMVLYLRHIIEKNNTLIIEEPESHLHPQMQVEFTRQLATLVKSGIRIVITTHSEWIIEELANVVRRSQIPDAERHSKSDNKHKVSLRPSDVGVWLFEDKRKPKGSVVKEVMLDDSGLYPSGYDEISIALYNEWADTSSIIEKTNS